MEYEKLPQDIQDINTQLERHFGIHTETGRPIWRISWSNDQYEKRWTDYDDKGKALEFPEVRELPKYQWIRNRWILERLVSALDQKDLVTKLSYEVAWVYKDRFGEYIVPVFEAAKFVVDIIYAKEGKKPFPKYIDRESKEPIEAQKERIDKLVEELFGDESDLMLRTVTGEASIVPRNYEKQEKPNESSGSISGDKGLTEKDSPSAH